MATWEVGSRVQTWTEPEPAPSVARQIPQLLAAGLVVLLMASGPYYVLRIALPQSQIATAVSVGPLEAPPTVRSALSVAAAPPGQVAGVAPAQGRFMVAFGRFERREAADARARLVRSKGYIARVVRSGAAYVVVSRSYRSLADAQFWTGVFGEIGLQAKALAQLEAERQGFAPTL